MKKRKAYRPGPEYLNTLERAIKRAQKMSAADAKMQRELTAAALREFTAGTNCDANWRGLADAANMAETLSDIGIGSGPDADAVIDAAQRALAAVRQRSATRGTWTLYAAEIESLTWLALLHDKQITECSYGEFERAFHLTTERIAQARAGNAPRGAIVVQGDMPARVECV